MQRLLQKLEKEGAHLFIDVDGEGFELDRNGMTKLTDDFLQSIDESDLSEKEVALVVGALCAACVPNFEDAHRLIDFVAELHAALPEGKMH